MNLITARYGSEHITVVDMARFHRALMGVQSCVFNYANRFAATVTGANQVTLSTGYGMIQGRLFDVRTPEAVTIDTGSAGSNRIDVICATVTVDDDTQEGSFSVVKGTPTSGNPVQPQVTEGNLDSGALIGRFPMFAVRLTGVNITAVTALFTPQKAVSVIEAALSSAQSTITQHTTTLNNHTTTLNNHTTALNNHTTALNGHTTTLSSHGTRLTALEKRSTGTATRNTTNTSAGTCKWRRIGKLVIVVVTGLTFKKDKSTSSGLVAFTGLPKPDATQVFGLGCGGFGTPGFYAAFNIDTLGKLSIEDAGTTKDTYKFRGRTAYFAAD